ncbi:MAG: GNAT family N-acetyltransferase [SAR324 cluster bacterium]|nr:GNAT family N-acetyltransferase [SAR324 cluster bacterium]
MSDHDISSEKVWIGFIHNLRAALPYLEEFHQDIFVIQLAGDALQHDISGVLDDLVLLYRVGIRIILIQGLQTSLFDPGQTQQTDEEYDTMEEIQKNTAFINWQLMTRLHGYGKDIVPISSHFIHAEKIDYKQDETAHFTGIIRDINTKALQKMTEQHYLPIIPPFAIGEKGRLLLLDPNRVAVEVAARIRARKLIILTETSQEEHPALAEIHEMTTTAMKQWLRDNQPEFRLRSSLSALIDACERGVERCHLLDSSLDGSLLAELLTSTGIGTMVTNSSYTQIRPARLSDSHMILEILKKPVQDFAIVSRSIQYVEQHIENFLVYCIDEELAGCCELIPYDDDQSIEIASLAVKETHRNRGIGRFMVLEAINLAPKNYYKLIFALTRTTLVFQNCGFTEMSHEQLPQKKRLNFDFQGSRVYGRLLGNGKKSSLQKK